MYLKKLIDKNIFDKNGYVVLDTELINNPLFNDLINAFENAVNLELKNSNIKKLGGYIMGNFGINQGPLGLKLYSLILNNFLDKGFLYSNSRLPFNILFSSHFLFVVENIYISIIRLAIGAAHLLPQ